MDTKQALIASIELCTDLHELLKLEDMIWEVTDPDGKWVRLRPGFEDVRLLIRTRRQELRDDPFKVSYLGVVYEGDKVLVDYAVQPSHPLKYISVKQIIVGGIDG